MKLVWLCRARVVGSPFPSFLGAYADLELLNWQVSGTVMIQGSQALVAAWAVQANYTPPQAPVPGIYLIDAETLFYVNARGQLVSTAVEVAQSLALSSPAGRWVEQSACARLVEEKRIFVLSDLNSFQVALLLLTRFGIRNTPIDQIRFR